MRSSLVRIVSILALAASVSIAAETAAPESVSREEAIRVALTSNPLLTASEARVQAAAGRAYQSSRWSNPELELQAEEWPVDHGGSFSDAKKTIGIAQTLPWPGKTRLRRDWGRAGVRLSQAEVSLLRTELVRDVKAAFAAVVASEQRVRVGNELVAVAEASAVTARKRVAAGATSYQEELRADIQLEQARADLAGLERESTVARQILLMLISQPDWIQVPVVGRLAEEMDTALVARADAQQLLSHPSRQAAEVAVELAQLDSRRARLDPYPDVRASVAGGRAGESDQSIVEFGLSIPLPIWDASKGRKEEARANLRVVEAELALVQQQLRTALASAVARYRAAAKETGSYRERIIPKAREALSLVQTGFEEGKFSFMDLLDTQRTFAETRLLYQQKLLELNVAQAELEALVLWEDNASPSRASHTSPQTAAQVATQNTSVESTPQLP